uniref:MULE transposase domain-containing protein n=1 Tax=Panagrolaimus superbus TaxID=310955 RepID=A0A914Y8S0_9BILA
MLKDRNGAVNILMDGQYDSPGYCAMMCKVTAIDAKSGYAVGIQTLQRTMTENKSARMEIEGVRRIMKEMENNGVHVDRATTDRNTGVIALFREEFPKTQHKNDTWHMVKGVKKDLMNESKKKRSQDLAAYVPLIKNHFWYSVEKANGDGEMCREILLSGLFHLIGIHKWKKGKICKQLKMYILRIIGKDDESYNQFLKKNPDNCSKFFKV